MSRLFYTSCVVVLFIVACGDNIRSGSAANTDLCAAVTCLASDACHDVGTCDATTGLCSNPAKADGAACSDGNACSTGDTCSAGVCGGGTATICAAADACHDAGTCDATTGSCSNPVKADGAACDDGNACSTGDTCTGGICGGTAVSCASPGAPDDCHVGVCTVDGSCGLADAPDGASCCGELASDRCTGAFHGTCSAGACTNIDACGDGFVELVLGESCDDGNTIDGDGCDAHCHVEPFQTTAPVMISGALACTTSVANAARKIAADGSGTIYAAFRCSPSADVVVSTDRGQTFTPPFDLTDGQGTSGTVVQVAVASGPSGVAYAAFLMSGGQVFLRVTQDRGATWSPAALLGTATSTTAGLSLAAFNDDVYVGFRSATGVGVARNHQRGVGTFDTTNVALSVTFFDLVFDIRLGTLAVATDTPTFHIRVSSDAGVTFGPEANPPGSEFFSDWTIGNGTIFVGGAQNGATGNSTRLFLIPGNAPTTSTSVDGLPSEPVAQARSVAADDLGDAFVASQIPGVGVQLDRLPAGGATFDPPRVLDPAGSSPIPAPLPGGAGAAVVYSVGNTVWATIQAY